MGRREELITEIEKELDLENKLRSPKLSQPLIHTAFKKVTGKQPDHSKTKAWHTRQILPESNKSLYGSSDRLPLDQLEKLLQMLEQ